MPALREDSDRFADLDRGSEEFQAAYREFDEEYKRLHHDNNAAERILPNLRYNLVYTMLHGLVFDIGPTSAAPIALQIRLELSDNEIRPLLEVRRPPASAAVNRLPLRARPHVQNERLRAEIKKARSTWAQKLAAHGFRDVDISFAVAQYQVEPFKSIKEELAALVSAVVPMRPLIQLTEYLEQGAKCYHFSGFKQDTASMTMSVVVEPLVLDHVLPLPRQIKLGITIVTNTAPASPVIHMPLAAEPDTEQIMVLAPPAADEQSPYDVPDPTKKPPTFGLKPAPIVKRDPCELIVQEIMGRQRSNTLKKVRVVPKIRKPWHVFSSSARAEQQQPAWTQETRPFRGDPGIWGDDQWWLDDLATREALINGWKTATWCEELGAWPPRMHRDLSRTGSDPALAVADKDFVLLPGLSPTYTTDRSRQWYEDNVEVASRAEAQREFVAAEQFLEIAAGQAQAFWTRFVQVQTNAKLRPWEQPTSFEMAQLNRAQRELANLLKNAEDTLAMKADVCEIRLRHSRFNVMSRLRERAFQEIEAAPHGAGQPQRLQQVRMMGPQQAPAYLPGQVMPDTPIPQRMAPAAMRQHRGPAPRRAVPPAAGRRIQMPVMRSRPMTRAEDTPPMPKQATTPAIPIPPRPKRQFDAPDTADMTAFPTYVDPMIELNKQLASVTNTIARSMSVGMPHIMPRSIAGSGLSTIVDCEMDGNNSLPSSVSEGQLDSDPDGIANSLPDSVMDTFPPSLPNSVTNDIPCTYSSSMPDSIVDSMPRSVEDQQSDDDWCSIEDCDVDSGPSSLSNSISKDIPCDIFHSLPNEDTSKISPSLPNRNHNPYTLSRSAPEVNVGSGRSLANSVRANDPCTISQSVPDSIVDSVPKETLTSISCSIAGSGTQDMSSSLSNSEPTDVALDASTKGTSNVSRSFSSNFSGKVPRSILQSISKSIYCPPPRSAATKALTDILMHANDLRQLRLKNSATPIDSAQGSQVQRVKFAVTERVYNPTMISGGLGDAGSDDETMVDNEEDNAQDFDETDDFVHDAAKGGIEGFSSR